MGILKFNIGDMVIGNRTKADFYGKRGVVLGHTHNKSEYYVFFVYKNKVEAVNSWWIDKVS